MILFEGMIIDVYYKLWDNFLSRNEDILANNTTNIAAINYKKLCMDWIYEDWDTQQLVALFQLNHNDMLHFEIIYHNQQIIRLSMQKH